MLLFGVVTLDTAIAFINASIAPAVLFTGAGLLLAGLQNKYSTLVQVIRSLHAERRSIVSSTADPHLRDRAGVISDQIDSLLTRARLVRNSICSFYLTILLLVISSFFMGLSAAGWFPVVEVILAAFLLSLGALLVGIGFATREALLSYQVIEIEFRR